MLENEEKTMKLGTCFVALIFYVDSTATRESLLLPNLPVGEYRLNFKGISQCTLPSKNLIQLNYYLSKKSANITEIKGNVSITDGIVLDDSFDVEFKLTVKDSIGGWKDNAYMHKASKACSTLKRIFGIVWTPFTSGLGIPNQCPIATGIYVATGADTALIMKTNFPKTFFYGTYKFHVIFSKNLVNYGCFILIVELKRPWEKD